MMGGRRVWVGLAACLASLGFGLQAHGDIVQGAGDNYLAFEAEAGRLTFLQYPPTTVRPFVQVGSAQASGGQYIETHGPSGSGGVNGQWTSTYNVVFDQPGTYNIYGLVNITNSSNDSMYTPSSLNSAATNTWYNGGATGGFAWRQSQTVNVTAAQVGTPQQFTIASREGDGFIIDRIVLSTANGLSDAQLNALPNNHATNSRYINPLNGQYYELGAGGTFDQAKTAAEASSFAGGQGQLAAVGSYEENRFLTSLFGPPRGGVLLEGWIGLTDNEAYGGTESAGQGNSQVDGWVFTTPGGPVTLASTGFTNWNGGEPNDFNGNEDAAQLTNVNIGPNGGVWNDIPLTGTQSQSFVEFNNQAGPSAQMRVVYGSGVTIDSLADAHALLDGTLTADREVTTGIYAVNFQGPQGNVLNTWDEGRYLGNAPFPGENPGGDDNFAAQITGFLDIPMAGDWTFGVNSDDGVELLIEGTQVLAFDTTGTFPADTLGVFNAATPGQYEFTLTYYEVGGGAGLEFFAAEGVYSAFDPTAFRLVGDFAQGGLSFGSGVVPEPATFAVWLLLGAMLWCQRRWRHRRTA